MWTCRLSLDGIEIDHRRVHTVPSQNKASLNAFCFMEEMLALFTSEILQYAFIPI